MAKIAVVGGVGVLVVLVIVGIYQLVGKEDSVDTPQITTTEEPNTTWEDEPKLPHPSGLFKEYVCLTSTDEQSEAYLEQPKNKIEYYESTMTNDDVSSAGGEFFSPTNYCISGAEESEDAKFKITRCKGRPNQGKCTILKALKDNPTMAGELTRWLTNSSTAEDHLNNFLKDGHTGFPLLTSDGETDEVSCGDLFGKCSDGSPNSVGDANDSPEEKYRPSTLKVAKQCADFPRIKNNIKGEALKELLEFNKAGKISCNEVHCANRRKEQCSFLMERENTDVKFKKLKFKNDNSLYKAFTSANNNKKRIVMKIVGWTTCPGTVPCTDD